jgi:hypothetical protein
MAAAEATVAAAMDLMSVAATTTAVTAATVTARLMVPVVMVTAVTMTTPRASCSKWAALIVSYSQHGL